MTSGKNQTVCVFEIASTSNRYNCNKPLCSTGSNAVCLKKFEIQSSDVSVLKAFQQTGTTTSNGRQLLACGCVEGVIYVLCLDRFELYDIIAGDPSEVRLLLFLFFPLSSPPSTP